MKRKLTLLLVLISQLLSAQDSTLLDRFCASLSGSCVDMSYEYSVRVSGMTNLGQGTLSAQGLMWTMKGNGVEMYCDAKSMWVIDPSLKEAVVEPAVSGDDTQMLVNPASVFVRMKDLFFVRESRPVSDGEAVLYILAPKKDGDFDYLNVQISKADALMQEGSFALKDGTFVNIKVSSMKLTSERTVEAFQPQTVFDSSWIVTDLR